MDEIPRRRGLLAYSSFDLKRELSNYPNDLRVGSVDDAYSLIGMKFGIVIGARSIQNLFVTTEEAVT